MNIIEHYDFGEIVVNGVKYIRDVIIFPDKVKANWWRKEGHNLCLEDLKDVLEYKPEILVIGTGYYGYMKVPNEVIEELKKTGIKVHVAKTGEAYKKFNQLIKESKKVVAALHLTC